MKLMITGSHMINMFPLIADTIVESLSREDCFSAT